MLGKMAWLSVLRRPKRTALIVLTVALSVFVMEFVSGWVQGTKERMNRKILHESPHLLIERKARLDALDPLEPRNLIPDVDADTVARSLNSDTRVARVEKVIRFGALIMAGSMNLPLGMYGVEQGTGFFSQVSTGSLRGGFPFSGPGIAVSRRALELLGSPDAQRLTVLVQDAYDAPSYRELPVVCVFRTDDSQFDAATAFVDAGTAAELLGTSGVSELWLRLKDPEQAAPLRASALALLQAEQCAARTWQEMQGGLLAIIHVFGYFMLVINFFVLIVAATVITNAILMNVFERQREYGTLRAIGMTSRQQGFLVLAEGVAQGLTGSILGAVLASPVILFLTSHGLAIGAASHIFGGGDVMYFGLNIITTLEDILFGALIAVVGSLYAAFEGTRSSVVDALKGA